MRPLLYSLPPIVYWFQYYSFRVKTWQNNCISLIVGSIWVFLVLVTTSQNAPIIQKFKQVKPSLHSLPPINYWFQYYPFRLKTWQNNSISVICWSILGIFPMKIKKSGLKSFLIVWGVYIIWNSNTKLGFPNWVFFYSEVPLPIRSILNWSNSDII